MKDTTIYSESSKVSNGGGQFIFAGNNNQSDSRRALIMFDIPSSINSKSQVVNVELSLEMDRAREGAFQVALYKLTNEWSEGSSQGAQGEGAGGTIQGLDATWKNRIHPGHAWIKRGGDFEIEPSAVSMVKGPGSYTWSGPRLNEDVQNWINGTHRNYGWILIGDESESITAKRFSSRTGPSAPVLEIEYIFN
ncbi:MAG: DNRLRE domain-containing protein [Dehalococcoidia bacterium]|nr:DNRLRE domain-containing protein [Dehalococcoidia bacterium]